MSLGWDPQHQLIFNPKGPSMPTPQIDTILTERTRTHGDWRAQMRSAQVLKAALREPMHDLPFVLVECSEAICLKLSRIAHGDPQFADHWQDIIGYATLALQWIEKTTPNVNKNPGEQQKNPDPQRRGLWQDSTNRMDNFLPKETKS